MDTDVEQRVSRAMEQGNGIFRLAPNWVPRSFCIPGRRLKLHPDDYYAMGAHRGGIDERWLSSTIKADNGPETLPEEGLSAIVAEYDGAIERFTLADAIQTNGREILGPRLMDGYGGWPMYAKFFDNKGALPHHLHQMPHHAALVGRTDKPEAYYFPPQLNNYDADFPYTFFGLEPGTAREHVRACLERWEQGDNKITNLSRAYRLETGTGWNVPPGILHAPGSLCTYEPQKASDVFAMFQSLTCDQVVPRDLLVKDVPDDKKQDLDFILSLLDWEANVDPHFAAKHFMRPKPVRPIAEMEGEGYCEQWVCYLSPDFSAKELTVFPGRTVTVTDNACYGLIALQGHGTLGVWPVEAPTLIRFGQLTNDEYFVSEAAAQQGVRIVNPSATDPIVLLKHFGPGNPDLAR